MASLKAGSVHKMSEDQTHPGRLGRRILWGIVVGVLLYAAIAAFMDFGELVRVLGRFPVSVFGAALGLSVVNYAVRWGKWHYYLRHLGFRDVPVLESAVVFVAGLTMAITPGKVGEVLKSVLLHESRGAPIARTAPIVIAERLTDLLGLFVIAAFGIGIFDYGRIAFFAILGGLLVGMAVLQSQRAVGVALDLLERLPWIGDLRDRIEEAYESMRSLLQWRPLIIATMLSVLSWSMEALAFFWILDALGAARLELNLAAFIFSMTTILGAVSFLPGGLGVTEGTMIGALLLFGVFAERPMATAATYLIRLATLWFAVGLGIFGLAAFRRMYRDPTNPLPP